MRDEDPMVLTISKDEIVYIKEEAVHLSRLVERLLPEMERRQDKSVFVKGDRAVRYGAILEVIQILNQAGVHRVGLVTDPRVNDN